MLSLDNNTISNIVSFLGDDSTNYQGVTMANKRMNDVCTEYVRDNVEYFKLGYEHLDHPECVPKTIKKLYYDFYDKTLFHLVPKSVTDIHFDDTFEDEFTKNDFPNNKITHLTFGDRYDQPVNNLPETLTHLTFEITSSFNQPVDNLPKGLTHLTFGESFDESVDNLPETLTHLTFGEAFDQFVDNLPKGLTHLTFGVHFNQPVDNLPESLTHLTFGHYFSDEVNNLPKNLTHIVFEKYYHQRLNNNLPRSLISVALKDKTHSNCKYLECIRDIVTFIQDEDEEFDEVAKRDFGINDECDSDDDMSEIDNTYDSDRDEIIARHIESLLTNDNREYSWIDDEDDDIEFESNDDFGYKVVERPIIVYKNTQPCEDEKTKRRKTNEYEWLDSDECI